MAVPKRFKVSHDEVFSFGSYMVGDVAPLYDFERSTKENKIQQVDKDTGLFVFTVDVVDADPEARKKAKTVTVKILATVQPVPPETLPGLPFRPVVFEGLEATPYIEESGSGDKKIYRLAWSFRATGITGVKSSAPVKAAS